MDHTGYTVHPFLIKEINKKDKITRKDVCKYPMGKMSEVKQKERVSFK